MTDFKKKLTFQSPDRNKVVVNIEWREGRLSVTGDVYQQARDAGGGQCQDVLARLCPDDPKVKRVVEVWNRWHLNDMRAGCEHQRAQNWRSCPGHYGDPQDRQREHCGNTAARRKKREEEWSKKTWPLGHPFCITPKHLERSGMLLDPRAAPCGICLQEYDAHLTELDRLAPDKPKSPYYCDYDRLNEPCPVCGYKFGSEWLREEVPQEILDEIASW